MTAIPSQRPLACHCTGQDAGLAVRALSVRMLDLRNATAGLAGRLRSGTGPSSGPAEYADTAAACTAAQLTGQASLLLQAAMRQGPAGDPGLAVAGDDLLRAGAGAPQLAGAALVLSAMSGWLDSQAGQSAGNQLGGAAACLAAAAAELSRIGMNTAGTR